MRGFSAVYIEARISGSPCLESLMVVRGGSGLRHFLSIWLASSDWFMDMSSSESLSDRFASMVDSLKVGCLTNSIFCTTVSSSFEIRKSANLCDARLNLGARFFSFSK